MSRFNCPRLLLALGLTLGLAALAPAALAAQTVYLDPQTGAVLAQPPADDAAPGREQPADSPYQAWETESGTQMLSAKPGADTAERVVRCADGSLHMGRAAPDQPAGDVASLCQSR